MKNSPTIAVSSWALHRVLGAPPFWGVAQTPVAVDKKGALPLLELPAELARRGFDTMELCHFHLPSRDAEYLRELKSALENSGVRLFSLLIDDGDITHPEYSARDAQWIAEWIPVARELGAQRMRVIAGKSSHDNALSQSAGCLKKLAARARKNGVRLTTENWFELLNSPHSVLELLDACEGEVGFNLDFGNWSGATKYEDLAAIAPRVESCHAKAEYSSSNEIEAEDYARCLQVMREVNFDGAFTLVSGGASTDDWQGVEIAREFITEFFA